MITLKSNTHYKTRDGRKAFVGFIHPHQANAWPCHGFIEGELQSRVWERGGRYIYGLDSAVDLVVEWVEPKLRPWKIEEIPLGAWIRVKTQGLPSLIVAINISGIWCGSGGMIGFDYALTHYEHSTDGGRTWHPCGVVE